MFSIWAKQRWFPSALCVQPVKITFYSHSRSFDRLFILFFEGISEERMMQFLWLGRNIPMAWEQNSAGQRLWVKWRVADLHYDKESSVWRKLTYTIIAWLPRLDENSGVWGYCCVLTVCVNGNGTMELYCSILYLIRNYIAKFEKCSVYSMIG